MRKWVALLLVIVLLLGLAFASAETTTDVVDLTGEWKMDYFGMTMLFSFKEDGTYEGLIDAGIDFDDGNDFSGTWEFDGTTMTIHGDDGDQPFTWDGEKLSGVMYDTEIILQRVIEPEA